ncbi:hypothetical protein Tco_0706719 [Tanacetum coccineum]|uniref:UBN2 domain-containing protein n=1 Tax=Tanacetum coccineum TaxID=301880 RepID=A0ABQ4YAA8_9ASTR
MPSSQSLRIGSSGYGGLQIFVVACEVKAQIRRIFLDGYGVLNTSPLEDDELLESQIVEKQYEQIEHEENGPLSNETINIKELRHHPLDKVKDCKIDLLTQQYEKFSISSEETIDSGFTRFNAIVTSLKSLVQDYSRKNHVRKFLRALPLKWRAKVMVIKEAKDLATLTLDELIGNLKVYEMILENDDVASKNTKEKVKSLALKAKVNRSSEKFINSDMAIDLATVLIGSKDVVVITLKTKVVKAQDKGEVAIIMAKKVTSLVSDQSPKKTRPLLEELGVIVKMVMNPIMMQLVSWRSTLKRLFTLYKAYDGGHVVFGSNLKGKQEGAHVRRMMGAGRWKGKIKERHRENLA